MLHHLSCHKSPKHGTKNGDFLYTCLGDFDCLVLMNLWNQGLLGFSVTIVTRQIGPQKNLLIIIGGGTGHLLTLSFIIFIFARYLIISKPYHLHNQLNDFQNLYSLPLSFTCSKSSSSFKRQKSYLNTVARTYMMELAAEMLESIRDEMLPLAEKWSHIRT